MRAIILLSLWILLVLCSLDVGFSQTNQVPHKLGIDLVHEGSDLVGRNLYYRIKEEMRKSSKFVIVANPKDAFVKVRVQSVAIENLDSNTASSVAVIMTLLPSDGYLHSQVLFVGAKRVDFAAAGIISGIDEYLEELFHDVEKERSPSNPAR